MKYGTARPRRGNEVTIEDVAHAAGVSRQTVSNALNAPERVRATTLERVKAAVQATGYRPDQSARSLKTGTRYTVGYFAPQDDPYNPNPVMGGFLEAMVDAAAAEGYRVLLFRERPGSGGGDPRTAFDELVAARQVDGFVLSDVLRDDPRIAHLAESGAPFVCFGRTGAAEPQNWADVDTARAMGDVVAALVAQGHRRVAYLGSTADLPWMIDRREGFMAAARAHGLDTSPALEPLVPRDDPARLGEAVRAMLRGPERPTALAAGSDLLALVAYEAARAEGLAVGDELAVTGFNDSPVCRMLSPQLTSVRLPLREIARELMGRLLGLLGGEADAGGGSLVPAGLVVRGSGGVAGG